MKNIFCILFLAFSIASCKDIALSEKSICYFRSPQPVNDSEISKIPNKFIGKYINEDSLYLNVEHNLITIHSFYRLKFHKKEIDSLKKEFYFSSGKWISKGSKAMFDHKEIGDSLELSTKEIDTFFIFSNSSKAKKINGKLVLNEKDSIFWRTKWISLQKNNLLIHSISSSEDIINMDSITKNKSIMLDSSTFILNPSRIEFKRFLEMKKNESVIEFKKTAI
jgi:hypothetical protein